MTSKITNYYETIKIKKVRNPGYSTHGLDLPFYGLILGGSGSMKSNLLVDFIQKSSGSFTQIIIVCRNVDEPLYNLLQEKAKGVVITTEIPDINDFTDKENQCNRPADYQKLIVFDDLVLNRDQSPIENYYIRARKLGLTCIYLSQSYYKVPKLIRINVRYIFIKKLASLKDLKLILSEYNMTENLSNVLSIYNEATKEQTGFMLVDIMNNKFTINYGI